MTNEKLSSRFIESYNIIDKTLRNIFGFKASASFVDVIRTSSANNALVAKFEDDLYSYSRLRNAIIHNSGNGKIIAEPHLDVVEHIEHICKLIITPPNVVDVLEPKKILIFEANLPLKNALLEIRRKEHSNIPIIDGNNILGIITPKSILIKIAEVIYQKKQLDDSFFSKPIKEFLYESVSEYIYAASNLSIVQALTYFSTDRKLKAVIITRTGDNTAPVLQIITSGDIVALTKILDNYNKNL